MSGKARDNRAWPFSKRSASACARPGRASDRERATARDDHLRDGLAGVSVAASALVLLYLRWIAQPLPRITEEQFVDIVTKLICGMVDELD